MPLHLLESGLIHFTVHILPFTFFLMGLSFFVASLHCTQQSIITPLTKQKRLKVVFASSRLPEGNTVILNNESCEAQSNFLLPSMEVESSAQSSLQFFWPLYFLKGQFFFHLHLPSITFNRLKAWTPANIRKENVKIRTWEFFLPAKEFVILCSLS